MARILNHSIPRERKIGMARLLKLADYLDTVPKREFDYSNWGMKVKTKNFCGTVACALGHAAMMKSLRDVRRCGLRLIVNEGGGEVVLDGYEGWEHDPGMAAFALTAEESDYLFLTDISKYQHSPRGVAKKIRKFVKDFATANTKMRPEFFSNRGGL